MPPRHPHRPARRGLSSSREYRIWAGMLRRMSNPRCRQYLSYGGRGIRVCRRWKGPSGFARFFADLGPQPAPRASLHRVDNDGPYAPGNVVWATAHTQARHRRSNRILTHAGRTMILADWAAEVGMKPVTLLARLRKGWSVEADLITPVQPRRPYGEWRKVNPHPTKRGPKPGRAAAAPVPFGPRTCLDGSATGSPGS